MKYLDMNSLMSASGTEHTSMCECIFNLSFTDAFISPKKKKKKLNLFFFYRTALQCPS